MELMQNLIDLVIHLDRHLNFLVEQFGGWTYFILFLVIFCETGLVVTPFLPGDSLLFALGALCAGRVLEVEILLPTLCAATILGDSTNYVLGYLVGPRVFHKERSRFLNRRHLDRAHRFYEKYGGKTVTIARFIPIIRTFAPFVAGIGRMRYWRFLLYSVCGGIFWIGLFIVSGYFFGNIPFVKQNFTLVIAAIVLISVVPAAIEILRHQTINERQ
jgi:membrane-associated protein